MSTLECSNLPPQTSSTSSPSGPTSFVQILATTPRGKLGFCWPATQNPIWKIVKVVATDSPLISANYLDSMKKTMPNEAFRMELLAEWVDESISAFPYALLDAAEDSSLVMET